MSRLPKFTRRKFARFFFRKGLPVFVLAFALALVGPQLLSGTGAQPPAQAVTQNITGISVEYSQQLFATMCALDAAGFEADESTLSEMPARLALRDRMLKLQGPATDSLRKFYLDHEMASPSQTLSRYITFALIAGPPPDFRFQVEQEALPPDVLAIQDFQDILANFYQEAHLGLRWNEVQPEYDRAVIRDDVPVRDIVTVVNGYLREILRPSTGRTFTVYVEPLVGNLANFRNFGDHYSIVIGAGQQFPLDDVRHAYLHFVLDPLPLRYRNQIEAKNALLNIAAKAPRLPLEYQTDFLSFTDECFIKAVEIRIRHLPADQQEKIIADDEASGFILVRPFVDQLLKFEKAEPAMTYYFPDIWTAIDVAAQQKRLDGFKFAPAPTDSDRVAAASLTESRISPLDAEIAEGNRDIAMRDPAAAAEKFQDVLTKKPGEPRAVYGLAVASVLMRQVDQAKALFEQVLAQADSAAKEGNSGAMDPSIVSWSHIYLGRIYGLEEDQDTALQEFQAAIAVRGAPEAARVAAQKAIDAAQSPVGPAGNSGEAKP
ncbi:MAG TPA: tetratricopeptide repeat protein [Candidatus Micrarchaeaceae archaeon]|nr:tetratricopeptide repeat protein [Candidatus Micrarchaeaceae archaeon]